MVPTVVTPGNIVVPLSTILDQLHGKLTSAEIDALVAAIVGGQKRQVNPGDLISAELMTQVLSDIADLYARVALLENSNSGLTVLGRIPSGDVAVLTKLIVIGTGFDPDPSTNTVVLGGVSITSFFTGESSPTQLSFQVPDLFTSLPRLLDLAVQTGGRSSNTIKVRVQPKVETQGGSVVIFSQTEPLGEITVGDPYTLKWLVDSQTALPATYGFKLLFTDITGASEAAWKAGSTLTPSTERQIVRGNPQLVTASVTVPVGATSAQIALEVRSTDGVFTRSSDPIVFEVGSEPEVSDPRANVKLPAAIGPFDPDGNPNPLRSAKILVGSSQLDGLQLKFGQTAEIPFSLFVTNQPGAPGAYAYSAEVEDPASAWQVVSVAPTNDPSIEAGDTRTILVKLKNTDAAGSNAVKFMVVRAAHSPQGSTALDFVSFIRFPIQGYSS